MRTVVELMIGMGAFLFGVFLVLYSFLTLELPFTAAGIFSCAAGALVLVYTVKGIE